MITYRSDGISGVYRIQILESNPNGYYKFFVFCLDWTLLSSQPYQQPHSIPPVGGPTLSQGPKIQSRHHLAQNSVPSVPPPPEVSGYWFFNSWSISDKFLNIHIQPLSESFWNLVSDIYPYPNATLVNTKQTGSGYRSTNWPSFLKTYSSIACSMTLIHDKCAVGWTMHSRNLVNLNLTLIKPKLHIWPQKFGNFWKK